MTKNLTELKGSFEYYLDVYQKELIAEKCKKIAVEKRIEDVSAEIARIMKNLQSVENIKERE